MPDTYQPTDEQLAALSVAFFTSNVPSDALPALESIIRAAQAEALRGAADNPTLRLSGHSGVSINRLHALADFIESTDV